MTFILGIKCTDGMGLFADTLETGGAVKRYRQKVHAVNVGSEWGVSWGVAGNAHVADKFSEKVRDILGNESYDRLKTELHIEQCLKWVRKQYSGSDDDIDVVVGIFGRQLHKPRKSKPYLGIPEAHLYRGDSLTACLAPVRDHCTAGMDVTLAAFVMETMRNPFSRMDEAIRLGVFATAIMKKYASRVGGDTNAFVYRIGSDTWASLLECEVTAIEATFPVSAIENHTQAFWMNHPQARLNSEMLASELALWKARGSSKPSASRRSKRGK
jgi:hypothetical protein